MAERIINTRSPFYIKVYEANLASAKLELKIWEGLSTDTQVLRYTIQKDELGTNNYVIFEVSELIRDYINNSYSGEYDSHCVWVHPVISAFDSSSVQIAEENLDIEPYFSDFFIATEGYGYFDEGINPDIDNGLMMSPATIYRLNDRSINVPVFAETVDSVSFFKNGQEVKSVSVSDNGNTNQKIQYISSDADSDFDTYKERVFEDGGLFEDNSLLELFQKSFDIGAVDEVYVNYTKDNVNRTTTFKVKTFECSKYEPVKLTFVNKFGALQDMYFTKRNDEYMNIKSGSYKSSIIDSETLSYNTSSHQQRTLNLLGNESITLNTDYIDESCNEHIKQLMLSEQIWMTRLTDEEKVIPLKIKTNSLQTKTRVNDRLIQYKIQFDIANDKINNVR